MPSDTVTLMVTTGLGVSVVAGLISGVCYVLVQGYKNQRNRKSPSSQWYCFVCNRHLRSIEGVLETERIVECLKCGKKICKQRCSKYRPLDRGWICLICRKQPPWYQNILNTIQPNLKLFTFNMDERNKEDGCTGINEIDEDIEAIRKKEKEQVRDFIERLVEAMLGDGVDDASVSRLYNNREYDDLFERYHQDLTNVLIDLGSALHISIARFFPQRTIMFFTILLNTLISMWVVLCVVVYGYHYLIEVLLDLPVSGQSPCTAHAALKQLIEKILHESLNLPTLNRNEEHPAIPEDNSRTYEDLLATAILNKVVANSQNTQPSSSAASISSRHSTPSKYKNKEYYFGDETLENKWKNADLETTSASSLEEWIHSDSSVGSTKYIDRVSLTIQQRIEEISPSESDNEIDDHDYETVNSTLLNSDDNNWYLQKRQFHNGTHSPVPVPMLVPNPTSEAKVLIGDREIDETSDLSDVGSDYGDIEHVPGLNTLLIESKTVIGGKNSINNLADDDNRGSDNESSADSGVKEDVNHEDDRHYDEKPKADISLDDENIEDTSILSVYSNTEKEAEYTEKYASLPRTIEKNSTEVPESGDLQFSGQYSKKEKEKWKHPIEMKHNPYTKESIEKRIKSIHTGLTELQRNKMSRLVDILDEDRQKRKNYRYGRDYYLRQASLPSGTHKKNERTIEDSYRAIPTIIDDDSGIVQSEIIENHPGFDDNNNTKQDNIETITSDSDLSLVNCYDVENGKVYRKTSDGGEQELLITVNTEGLLYKPINNDEINEIQIDVDDISSTNISIEFDSKGPIHIPEEFEKIEMKPENNIQINANTEEILDDRDLNENRKEQQIPEVKPRQTKATPIAPKRSKKSDNTLIKKIYSDPVVRNFALNNREEIPIDYHETSAEILISTPKINNFNFDLSPINIEQFEKLEKTPMDNFSLELSSDNEILQRQTSIDQDPEITQLKQKRLVANRLGEFSKSFPNLTKIQQRNEHEPYENRSDTEAKLKELKHQSFVSVKDLKKKFESNEAINKSKPVHSLTARSISKPIRDKLKNEDNNNRTFDRILGSPEYKNVEEETINTNQ